MHLEIEKTNVVDIVEFSNWLINKIQKYFMDVLDTKRLVKFDEYLNQHKVFYFNYNEDRQISTKNILLGSIFNLRVRETGDKVTIEIDPNIAIPNTTAKFINIAKLINFGNLSLQEYPIFDETMEYFARNLNTYYKDFKEETA